MLFVVAALLYLYISAGVSFISTWRQAKHASAQVSSLEQQNRLLKAQHQALGTRTTLWREARTLGMAKPGEITYIVKGLPNN
jgi:cell division protein FtsB